MKINELIWFKAIYPRGRDQYNDNEIKYDVENVGKIKDYIALHKKLPQKITYNKNHIKDCPCGRQGYHILDGTHTYVAASESGWKEIPKEYLTEVNIPLEQEMWEAGRLNASHGKQLSRNEIQAIFWIYFDPDERPKYGTIEKFSKDFCVPVGTLREWLKKERGQREVNVGDHPDSSGNEVRQDDVGELKLRLSQLEGERDKERAEKEEFKAMKDDAMNDNMGLKDRIKKLEEQLNTIPKRCPKCNMKIY